MTDKTSHAQIVATLGPASGTAKIIEEMVGHQMDVVRLNLSWGTHEEHSGYIAAARKAAEKHNRKLPIIIDLSGPRAKEGDGHRFGGSDGESIITEKDKKDIAFAFQHEVEYIALSYVGYERDVLELRDLIQKENLKIFQGTIIYDRYACINSTKKFAIKRR